MSETEQSSAGTGAAGQPIAAATSDLGSPGGIVCVAADSHLTLHYRVSLREPLQQVISTFGSRPATIQMGAGHLAPALEACLVGLPEGASRLFELDGAAAYGERHPDLIQRFSRRLFDAHADTAADGEFVPGDVVEFNGPGGERVAGVLKTIDAQSVLVDLNHPLAGQDILFEVDVIGVL